MERLQNVKLSELIGRLIWVQDTYGDLPICSDGNEPDTTVIRLHALRDDSTSAPDRDAAKKLFIEIY